MARFVVAISFVLLLSSIVPPSFAQIANVTNDQATPIQAVGHDYVRLLSETVSPGNGSVSLRMQTPTPRGRLLNMPFGFAYEENGVHHFTTDPNGAPVWAVDVTPYSRGGWSYLAPLVSYVYGQNVVSGGGQTSTCAYYTAFVYQNGSGERHALRIASAQPYSSTCLYPATDVPAGGDDFYAASTVSHYVTPNAQVADSDGTVYSFGCGPSCQPNTSGDGMIASTIEDRNGNTIKSTTNSQRGYTFTDTVGRALISSSSFASSSGDTITISGISNPYRVTWKTVGSNFTTPITPVGGSTCSVPTNTDQRTVVSTITLPNGQKYTFLYGTDDPNNSNPYGLLSKITYPSGGWVKYSYGINSSSDAWGSTIQTGNGSVVCSFLYGTPAVSQRTVSSDGTTVALQQTFAYSTNYSGATWTSKTTTVTTHDMVAGQVSETDYIYSPVSVLNPPNMLGSGGHQVPVEQTITYKDGSANVLQTVTKTWQDQYLMTQEQVTLGNGGPTSKTTYTYGSGGQVTEKDEYDFNQSSPTRKTIITYQSFPSTPIFTAYASIFDRPCKTVVYDGTGTNVVSETDTLYDGGTTVCGTGTPLPVAKGVSNLPSGTHDETHYGASSTAPRGNVTTVTRRCFQSCADAITKYSYDQTGQVFTIIDPCGNASCADMTGTNHITTYSYVDNYDSPPTSNTNAYLTQITNALGQSSAFKYAYSDGQPIRSQDQNDINASRPGTTYLYNDSLRRLTETDYPDGGKTTISYNDAPPSPSVTTTRLMNSSGQSVTSVSIRDGLGHVVQTQLSSDLEGTDYTDTTHDGLGRVWKESNPHRASSSPTDGTTTYLYDVLNRVTKVTHPDGTVVNTTYTGRATQVADEGNGSSQVIRISQADALGRVRLVCEVTSTTLPVAPAGTSPTPAACGLDITATGFLTTYGYDLLDNLTSVAQGGENRSALYNSLSRMTQASNPESGTIGYSYDNNGNVMQRVRAGVTTNYQYDALNRLLSVQYSDGTPTNTYNYDEASAQNAVGRKTSEYASKYVQYRGTVYSGGSSFSYDSMGRPIVANQCSGTIGGAQHSWQCGGGGSGYSVSYTYDLMGNVKSSTNGAGVTLTNSYNGAGRLTTVSSSLNDANHPSTLLSNVQYNAFGKPTQDSLGNGFTEAYGYTSRGQLQSFQTGPLVLNTAAVAASGTFTINGPDKSYVAPATAGHGTVIVQGAADNFYVWYPCGVSSCPTNVYDTGTVKLTINGVPETYSYGNGTYAYVVASSLANSFNSSSANVSTYTYYDSSQCSLNQACAINITAKTAGASTNYAMSDSSVSNDPSHFSPPSFYTRPLSSTLTGGTDAHTVYDSGNINATVNGCTSSPIAYNGSSATSTLASSLATSLNTCSTVSASAPSGSNVVTVTARTAGVAGNSFAMSSSTQSSDPSHFNPGSFLPAPSGPFLAGGKDATYRINAAYSVSISYYPDGDVSSINDSVNGNWTYTYDALNRLATASKSGQGFSYVYDRFGNRWQQNVTAGTGPAPSYAFDANNHIIGSGISYDTAGNIINDGVHTYAYDGEGRISNVDGGNTKIYNYDAEGRRVRSGSVSNGVDYVYDLAGDKVAEIDSATDAWLRGEVFAEQRHLAAYYNSTTYFAHNDWLGTERARTSVAGAVVETCMSLPYGDAQACSGTDVSPLHFTGKERDTESGLDMFGARYYGSSLGRFMTPDWAAMPKSVPYANFGNPQSLNLYSYTKNNPTTLTDPDGHCDVDVGGGKTEHHWGWCVWHTLGFYQTQPEMHAEAQMWRSILPGIMTKGVPDAELLRTVRLSMAMSMGGGPAGEAGALEAEGGALGSANYAQRTFSENFSSAGAFAGKTVDEVASALRSGELKPTDVPIQYVVKDGQSLILNTRSAQALERAGIPRSQWYAVNMTGDAAAEARLAGQLQRNNLTNSGTPTVTPEQ